MRETGNENRVLRSRKENVMRIGFTTLAVVVVLMQASPVVTAQTADGEIISKQPLLTVEYLPGAGTDKFDSTARITIEVPADVLGNPSPLTETVHLEGPTTVERDDPDASGVVETEIVAMQLSGMSDLVGQLIGLPTGQKAPILIFEHPGQASTGQIATITDPPSFMADSFFEVKLVIQTPLGTVPGQVRLEAMIDQIPPLNTNYIGSIDTAILGPDGTVVARITGQFDLRPIKPAIPVNTDVDFVVRTVVTNVGPDGPADFDLTVTAIAPPDCTITPSSEVLSIEDLAVGEQRTVQERFTVHCSEPSQHHFQITNEITPVDLTDPDPANNLMNTELRVAVIGDADGEIISKEPVDPPTCIPFDTDVEFVVRTVVTNAGPFGPADFHLTATAIAPPDCTITPRGDIQVIEDLAVGEQRTVLERFTVRCSELGEHHFRILNKITPVDVHVADPDLSNDMMSTEWWVETLCETAYAYSDVEPSTCFSDLGLGFSNWGWTIHLDEEGLYEFDLYAGAGQCDIGKGTFVGTVTVDYSGGTVDATFSLEPGHVLYESHVYAGNTLPVPTKKGKPTVAPGQYYIEPNLADDIYVIVHAVICSCE